MTRYPPGLISALEKLRDDQTVTAFGLPGDRSPLDRATDVAESAKRVASARINRLFDTHPPLEERIAALREL